ncbi:MAG: Uncharacterized protein G01um101418_764 [Parcubacteria group bacterium Gr01-1014_18]|nr:MAG: Uncharacterized protein Greene041636_766 [Parcubacteria group bacterium Greene0416_36]TSC80129.1 MAG: Uncharacterized protein G01um101418_764 [Parcubacteria group bacterium Gr01-1014_18]TSC99343.1 MAG: Uncharacterized protein Greene101420_271 [Parcubacteria group bacterium Greene1014_20]TSD06820.1 MAG: Uncharacterized protein Greene07142_554 [Parcubacteria group bacterium Greene0714_2]
MKYYGYMYGHIDDYTGLIKWRTGNKKANNLPKKSIANAFTEMGWEGDGEINLIWVAPFLHSPGTEGDYGYGSWIYHVKQSNNGSSFLLSPFPLHTVEIGTTEDGCGGGLHFEGLRDVKVPARRKQSIE